MDSAAYSRSESVPDLSNHPVCDFCRLRMPIGTRSSYCDDWCRDQDEDFWNQITRTDVAKSDRQEGRQWLTQGGDGL